MAAGDQEERSITAPNVPGSGCDNRRVYRELPPPPDLAPVLACVWSTLARGGRILPDGCADVVWDGADLVVAGPATVPSPSSTPLGTPVFGVRFRVGAAGTALGLPAEELTDLGHVALEAVWGSDAEPIREAAAADGLPGLIGALRGRLLAAELDPLARAAALGLARPGARVAELGAELGISERQLRRRFADAVGYGPKTLARVLRFQRFLTLAAGGDGARGAAPGGDRAPAAPARDLARLAFAAGYSDQAHLTHECRRLAGRTPAELLTLGAPPAGERLPWRG
jgi:AraC-like DNA-binding protein